MHSIKTKRRILFSPVRVGNDYIKFPKEEAETRDAIEAFEEISSFPQVVLQGVADAKGRFIHVSPGYAGSIHDARVPRMSSLLDEVENGRILVSPVLRTGHGDDIKPLLVADPAY